jgi:diphosphomevalonate decarboxylase
MMQKKDISGKLGWRSPSNIALVKYWGKKPVQVPANPSLSITLSRAYTEMTLEFSPKEKNDVPFLEFLFEGRQNGKFADKISGYLHSLAAEFPIIKGYCFKISSSNTFPHSTGIASSASSMSALGLCLAEFLSLSDGTPMSMTEASRLSRLASGSACRSVYGGFVTWGRIPQVKGTSDEYAIPVPFEVHPAFREMKDAILVVSSKEKDVSSRAGHSLMDGHPYASKRYELAAANVLSLCEALKSGDMDEFVRITESEALNLHALMMSSDPDYLLLEPGTLSIIKAARQFRKETAVPVCFTLDAGPNVHLLYPRAKEPEVMEWIENELLKYCENGRWIDDEIGQGPERLENRN